MKVSTIETTMNPACETGCQRVRRGREPKHSGFHKVAIRGAFFVALCGVGSIGLGQTPAKEGTYDYMSCFSGEERASISTDSSHRAVLQDYTGSNRAAVPGAYLDGSSFHCIALINSLGPKTARTSICEAVDRDGDRTFTRFTGDGVTAENVFIGGTGKYVGMERTGKAEYILFPVIQPGTFQTCVRQTGTYKLK
jgi:hypothetical protein